MKTLDLFPLAGLKLMCIASSHDRSLLDVYSLCCRRIIDACVFTVNWSDFIVN